MLILPTLYFLVMIAFVIWGLLWFLQILGLFSSSVKMPFEF